MSNEQPIAVFDSGIGGISILRELIRQMPGENYIYYGDSANAPYGSKTHDEIRNATLKNVDMLINMEAKAVVIACNTATSVAIDDIRRLYPDIPVIGIEPALKPAVLHKPNSTVIVMATPTTLSENKFADLMQKYSKISNIIPLPCHKLAKMIENGILEGAELENYLKELFEPYQNIHIDSIVLGCTHYPFVKRSILKIFEYEVEIFDGASGTARETKRRIEENDLCSDKNKGYIKIMTSSDCNKFKALVDKLLTAEI